MATRENKFTGILCNGCASQNLLLLLARATPITRAARTHTRGALFLLFMTITILPIQNAMHVSRAWAHSHLLNCSPALTLLTSVVRHLSLVRQNGLRCGRWEQSILSVLP